jgi:hypothetical protein
MIYMTNKETEVVDEIITNDEVDEITRAERLERAKVAAKPLIDHLEDAVGNDQFGNPVLNAKVGDKIIIERVASVLNHKPWLDTKTYVITSIDGFTGDLVLMDHDLGQVAGSNYITGLKHGYRFKLPNSKGMSIGKRKRGRPRKNPTGAPEPGKPVQLGPDGTPVAKKRGRPAGTKNRSKDVIRAEKKAKLEKRAVRKTKRKQAPAKRKTKR